MTAFVITGTDTGIGKTVFAAALTGALAAHYWKPVQAGLDDGADADTVARLAGVPQDHILAEAYRLTQPLSPHRAAELDGVVIDLARLVLPPQRPLVVEGAGGVLVPITRETTYADVFARWNLPMIVVARTALGTKGLSPLWSVTDQPARVSCLSICARACCSAASLRSSVTPVTLLRTRTR